jgi:HAD superfamily hydrolase (TIGR01450 family)
MLLLVDLDGVVYRGPEPVPGVAALLAERAAAGDTVLYCTNNSSRHRTEYLAQLHAMGAPVREDRIFTSARATALELRGSDPPIHLVMVLGARGLARELRDVGLETVPPTTRGLVADPDAVVVGIDRHLTYARLAAAAKAVREGARFVATNRDPVFPGADGVAALETAARRPPDLVVGKPGPILFESAARSVGRHAREAVVIGDALGTDIAAAHAVGARSVLMLTGVTSRADLAALAPELRPTAVAADAAELRRALERLSAEG